MDTPSGMLLSAIPCNTQGHDFDPCLHRENAEFSNCITATMALMCQCCCLIALLFIKAKYGNLLSTVCKTILL